MEVVIFILFYGLPFIGAMFGFVLVDRVRGRQRLFWIAGLAGGLLPSIFAMLFIVYILQGLTNNEFLDGPSSFEDLAWLGSIYACEIGLASLVGAAKPFNDPD